jgi:S-adenosylhomocysteine hydrolase
MEKIMLLLIGSVTVLILGIFTNLAISMTGAQSNANQSDMKIVTDNINKSLAKITGGNSYGLLKSTLASINNTANQIVGQGKGIVNDGSLETAAAIAKKIGIGFADVLSNISGEIKQGIESK